MKLVSFKREEMNRSVGGRGSAWEVKDLTNQRQGKKNWSGLLIEPASEKYTYVICWISCLFVSGSDDLAFRIGSKNVDLARSCEHSYIWDHIWYIYYTFTVSSVYILLNELKIIEYNTAIHSKNVVNVKSTICLYHFFQRIYERSFTWIVCDGHFLGYAWVERDLFYHIWVSQPRIW